MIKFDNYVYLLICEVSYENFKKTEFSSYHAYCKIIVGSFNDEKLSYKEMDGLNRILDKITIIYGLSEEEGMDYVVKFFMGEKNKHFASIVIDMNRLPYNIGR